jgi:polar amino acid transport system substrate-binding protein
MLKKIILGIALMTLVAGGAAYYFLRPQRITLVTDEWCPFNCQPDSTHPGAMIEIARTIFAKQGIKVDYKIMPWSEAISAVREGRYDGIVGTSRNDAPDFVFPKYATAQMYTHFFTLPNKDWRYVNIESLKRIRLGVIQGYSYGEPLDSYIKDNADNPKRLHITDGKDALTTNIHLLLQGSIDALAEEHRVLTYKLATLGMASQLVDVGDLGHTDATNLYVAFSPIKIRSRRYAALLDEAIGPMRQRGELKAIFDHYAGTQ